VTVEPSLPVAAARAAARFSKSLELALGDVNLSLPQYRLLSFLSRKSERATALAGSLDVSPPSLTALVDGCVARGWVERLTSPEDRRRVLHLITPAGNDVLAQADVVVAERLATVLAHVPPTKARKIIDGLELLWEALEATVAAASVAKPVPDPGAVTPERERART
jgi:DNA-binding MarR family transcriptional regulator